MLREQGKLFMSKFYSIKVITPFMQTKRLLNNGSCALSREVSMGCELCMGNKQLKRDIKKAGGTLRE